MTFVEGLGSDGIFGPVVYEYPEGEVFSSELKSRKYPQSILTFPNSFTEDLTMQLHRDMHLAVKALDIRGYGRADFRIDANGVCYFLEMNAQTPEIKPDRSDFLAPVFRAGYTYEEIVLHMVDYAIAHLGRLPSMAGLYNKEYIIRAVETSNHDG